MRAGQGSSRCALALVLAVACGAVAGCAAEGPDHGYVVSSIEGETFSTVCAFTSCSTLAYSPPMHPPDEDMTGDRRCNGVTVPEGAVVTPGLLEVEFSVPPQTEEVAGEWAPKHVGAVWISDAQDRQITTLAYWGTLELGYVREWIDITCPAHVDEALRLQFGEPVDPRRFVDVVSGATFDPERGGDATYSATWDGTDLLGTAVPDGTYRLHIEVSSTEEMQPPEFFYEFTKGPEPLSLVVPDTTIHTGLTLTYMPGPGPDPVSTTADAGLPGL